MADVGYTPPQWTRGPAMVSITQVPTQGQSNFTGGGTTAAGNIVSDGSFLIEGSGSTSFTYVFDAVLILEHTQRLEKTRHPVQTGADISSHAYLMPAELSMEIGMSDVMSSFSNGQSSTQAAVGSRANAAPFTGDSNSRSVNAYQTMLALQAARQPLTITTRLRTYTNMLITAISPREDHRTITGLRMRLQFEQILTGSVSSYPSSARPDATDNTGLGTVNAQQPSGTTQNQFQIPQQTPGYSIGGDTTLGSIGTSVGNTTPPPGVVWGYDANGNWVQLSGPVDVPGAGSYSSEVGQKTLPVGVSQ